MVGSLDMNSQYINNVSTPSTHFQGANKAYVDLTALSLLGGNKMLADLDINHHDIKNVKKALIRTAIIPILNTINNT